MCSVDPDEVTLMTRPETIYDDSSDVACRKCGVKPIQVVLKKTDPYCSECFLSYLTHKFRSCIGKHKAEVPANSDVLVGVSGGPSSTAMMHLVDQGVKLSTLKKLRVNPHFIHIDLTGTGLPNVPNPQTVCDSVHALGHSCLYFPIEGLYDEEMGPRLVEEGISVASLRQEMLTAEVSAKFSAVMSSFSCEEKKEKSIVKQKLSAKQSLVRTLTTECLSRCCSFLQLPKLFLGSSASQIASLILSAMAEGRGAHVTRSVTFLTADGRGFDFCRPMREILEEEVLYYLTLNKISYHADLVDKDSIVGCTKSFLSTLQDGFPNTVPTVFRIGDKLAPYEGSLKQTQRLQNEDDISERGRCSLCKGILDCYQPDASALHAILLSERISTSSPVEEQQEVYFQHLIEDNKRRGLCNGCRITASYMTDATVLPIS